MSSGTLQRIREIPYNYTSFSDREIVIRFMGEHTWDIINQLRSTRRTGRSARMLFEVLGDMWMVKRNPYIQDDLFSAPIRWKLLLSAMTQRVDQIESRADGNELALELVRSARNSLNEFEKWYHHHRDLRVKVKKRLVKVTRQDNIQFDGTSRAAHVTDASDWRVEYPFVVLTPDTEDEVADIVRACIDLGLTIIPRGGGTGYTGSCTPLVEESAIINTEKLDFQNEIEVKSIPGAEHDVPVVHVGAGVVTRRLSEQAERSGYTFAVDPTSWDASCIGGNIAMNAGGKKAVLWGCTLDNLVSWNMIDPDGYRLVVERIAHNEGKIHDQEDVEFCVTRYEKDHRNIRSRESIKVKGKIFRKQGLGKDVTDKYLAGIPGIQKEGTDGIITSATFLLHKIPSQMRTVCLEFFGPDLRKATPAIVEVKNFVESSQGVLLTGLEHLDERYIKAVNYSTKAARRDRPKMIILADIAGDDDRLLDEVCNHIVDLVKERDAEGFIAVSPKARQNFWHERSRTAAIAKHTNAFKVNEDVVIPLERLPDYSEGIEKINIEESTKNKIKMIDAILEYIEGPMPELWMVSGIEKNSETETLFNIKKNSAKKLLLNVKDRWSDLMSHLDQKVSDHFDLILKCDESVRASVKEGDTFFTLLLRRDIRISYRLEVETPLQEIFDGHRLAGIRKKIDEIHHHIRASRLFVAMHMHAGDGNVHTNIPVHSNDYEMLNTAHHIVERVMELAKSLGGVISGEHGIGITKFQFLDQEKIEAFRAYKERVDPNGHFNKRMLMDGSDLRNAYTPSLGLVELEAIILEKIDLGALNDAIRNCLRCGKCKPVCSTHIPRASLLFSPRNKILSAGQLIEAFLYEEQTRRGLSLGHFEEFHEIADHCSVCHKCKTPCPVDIDFGDVTIHIRNILLEEGRKHKKAASRLAMSFLSIRDPDAVNFMRTFVIKPAFNLQRIASKVLRMSLSSESLPSSTVTSPTMLQEIKATLKKPLPSLHGSALRDILSCEESGYIPIIRDPLKVSDESETVFYFPGCGSERLFPQVGIAALAALYDLGVRTVLPPEYLCCGYPQASSGDEAAGRRITADNRVLFYRMANSLNYLDIKTVLVSCGTCMDQLLKYQFEHIFPNARLLDIHEYLMEKDFKVDVPVEQSFLYHDPCHTPVKTYKPLDVARFILGERVALTDRCCGEAGTLAVSRPDISNQLRYRKESELKTGIHRMTGDTRANRNECKIVTSCPACVQGLSRYRNEIGTNTDFIVVEAMYWKYGKNWQKIFTQNIMKGGVEKILL